jgi:alcohol dehydrogenase (cytochrome c)
MRARLLAALLCAVTPAAAYAQTSQDLLNDQKTPGDVLVYGMGYSGQRYSPLTQINKRNASQLTPKWTYSLTDNRGSEGFPVVKDGVMYVTTHSQTSAVNVETGAQIWRTNHEYPPEALRTVCCGIVNRGVAMYEGLIIRQLIDNQVMAMEAKSGKEVWRTKSPAPASTDNGYAMTSVPLIVNGTAIVGVAGAEYGHRGFIEGYDAKTGKHMWRHYNVPAAGEKGAETWAGETMATGGGSSWNTGVYDPDLDLVYWGTGNPSPWNPRTRKGDALWTNSIVAIRPKTGERVWFYQFSPEDPFDYDSTQQPVIATIPVAGKQTKVVMQANRNGFLYVLDAKDGKLLAANAFGKVTWADGVDLKTGRPRHTQVYKDALAGKKVEVWPSVTGTTNWQHMSFSPRTGLLYINTIHVGMTYEAPEPKGGTMKPGQPSGPGTVRRTTVTEDPNVRGYMIAVDPLTAKAKWKVATKSPNWASTMVTASDVVFTGTMTGEFEARDANTGKLLYSFRTPSGILSQPVTFEHKGRQYVAIQSGIGGVYALRAGDPNLENIPAGASLWLFGLPGK